MKSERIFYRCGHCGNLIGFVENAGVSVICCGEPMTALKPNTADAAKEKHLPSVTVSDDGNSVAVRVGGAPHPMEPGHHIAFVYVETERGGQRKNLKAGEEPALTFTLSDDSPVAVYAYCNLHGLWKTELE